MYVKLLHMYQAEVANLWLAEMEGTSQMKSNVDERQKRKMNVVQNPLGGLEAVRFD